MIVHLAWAMFESPVISEPSRSGCSGMAFRACICARVMPLSSAVVSNQNSLSSVSVVGRVSTFTISSMGNGAAR